MGTVTVWWEDGITPVLLEVVTTEQRFRAINGLRHQHGGTAFCEGCEVGGFALISRGFLYDGEDSGVIMCFKCWFDNTTIWSILARGDQRDELTDAKGTHRVRATANQ